MRPALLVLAALLGLPPAAPGTVPHTGRYTAAVARGRRTQAFPLDFAVRQVADSTELTLNQGEQPIPLSAWRPIEGGFEFRFGASQQCRLVRVDGKWEGMCVNIWDWPQFSVTLTRKVEPDPS